MDLRGLLEEFGINLNSEEPFLYREVTYKNYKIPKPQKKNWLKVEIELSFHESTLKFLRVLPLKILELCKFQRETNPFENLRERFELIQLEDQSILYDLKGWQDFNKIDVEEKISYLLNILYNWLQNLDNQVKEKTLERNKQTSLEIPGFFNEFDSIKSEDRGYFREISRSLYERITNTKVFDDFQPFYIVKRKNDQNVYFYEAYYWKNEDQIVVFDYKIDDLASDKSILEGFYNKIFNEASALCSPKSNDLSYSKGHHSFLDN